MANFDGKDTIILSDEELNELNKGFCGNDLDNTGERMKEALANQVQMEPDGPENPWKNLPDTNGKYIAKGDEKILHKCNDEIREKGKRNSKYKSSDYLFDLEILPEPFWGDIRNAEVFILSGNPGLGKDEKNFNQNETFKNVTLKNISLEKPKIVWLDQNFKKDIVFDGKPHPGFKYWEYRTRVLRKAVGNDNLNICIIEYFPYHSKKISSVMRDKGKDLPSCKFVDHYIKEAIKKEKWIVIARCKSDWLDRIEGLRDYKNKSKSVLLTSSQQMYLTPRNLVNKDELKKYEKCPEDAPTWNEFVEACTCKLKQ